MHERNGMRTGPKRPPAWMLGIAGLVAGAATLGAVLPSLQPAFWITLLGAAALGAGAILPGGRRRRLLCFNAAFLLLLFALVEAVLSVGPNTREEGENTSGYMGPHPELGYAPKPLSRARFQVYSDDLTVYDVTYNFDEHGLRTPPPSIPGAPCALFFGGSFMFGEGLEDHEALPYQVGAQSDGRLRVHNFGFRGYGTHQMLAAFDSNLVANRIDCDVRYVVYLGADFHIPRAAGLSWWERGGPRFELVDGRERVERNGVWNPKRFVWPSWMSDLARHSMVVAKIMQLHRPPNDHDYQRMLGILGSTRAHIETAYPQAEFRILFLDEPDDTTVHDLEARDYRVHRISEILPDREANPLPYQVHERDGHPSALANRKIAAHLLQTLEIPDAEPR